MWKVFKTILFTLAIVFCVLVALLATGWFGYTLVLGILAIHNEYGLWGSIPSGILCFAAFARTLSIAKK